MAERPGENWGSLLAINIEPMDAPDGFVSPTPKAAGKPKARIHLDFPVANIAQWNEELYNLDSFMPFRVV